MSSKNFRRADLLRLATGPPAPAVRPTAPLGETKRDYYLWLAAATGFASCCIAAGLLWTQSQPPATKSKFADAQAEPLKKPQIQKLSEEAKEAYSESLSHLSDALNGFPQQSAAEILRAVAQKDHSCSFEWQEGAKPAFVFRANSSLAATLDGCASAVQRFRLMGVPH